MKNYTVKELSKILDVNDFTIKRRINDGSLKASKENGKYIISEEGLNAFLKAKPRYLKKAKQPHQSDAVVDIISVNEAFNTYAIYLKKLMMLPKDDETIINYILPIVENHKSLLDMCINELKAKGEK